MTSAETWVIYDIIGSAYVPRVKVLNLTKIKINHRLTYQKGTVLNRWPNKLSPVCKLANKQVSSKVILSLMHLPSHSPWEKCYPSKLSLQTLDFHKQMLDNAGGKEGGGGVWREEVLRKEL